MNVEKAQEEILKERTLILSNRQKVNKSNATLSLLIDFFPFSLSRLVKLWLVSSGKVQWMNRARLVRTEQEQSVINEHINSKQIKR